MIQIGIRSENKMCYNEAILYCQFLELKGCRDWRLPTYEEFQDHDLLGHWYVDRQIFLYAQWYVLPVRDIE